MHPNMSQKPQPANAVIYARVSSAAQVRKGNAWDCKKPAARNRPREGLISLAIFEKIQERLSSGAKSPARKDANADLRLRGFVVCSDCETPLTACWSESKTGDKHPYYLCQKKSCPSYRKSIRHADLEEDFDNLIAGITLAPAGAALRAFSRTWRARVELNR